MKQSMCGNNGVLVFPNHQTAEITDWEISARLEMPPSIDFSMPPEFFKSEFLRSASGTFHSNFNYNERYVVFGSFCVAGKNSDTWITGNIMITGNIIINERIALACMENNFDKYFYRFYFTGPFTMSDVNHDALEFKPITRPSVKNNLYGIQVNET